MNTSKIIETYQTQKDIALKNFSRHEGHVNKLSFLRLTIIVALLISLYYHESFSGLILTLIILSLIALFGFIVTVFQKQRFLRDLNNNIANVNSREIDFVNNQNMPFKNGEEYINTSHDFSYDLDLFGQSSLFQYLNRTHSYIGHDQLAEALTHNVTHEHVVARQEAITELESKLNWRQNFLALTELHEDNKSNYDFLASWSTQKDKQISKLVNVLSFILPIIFIIGFICNIYFQLDAGNILTLLFIINLSVLGSQMKTINSEIQKSTKLNKILYHYSLLIREIENTDWNSDLLKKYKAQLATEKSQVASDEIRDLSKLFASMDTINNAVGAAMMNGSFLFHIHKLRSLLKWKKENGSKLIEWIDVIGKFESLICFSNFKHNNPNYTFPKLNHDSKYTFSNLGHPLIDSNKRVCSDVDFSNNNFIVLTGSNMSGKSTFLRSLGINIVLAKSGSVVCADSAEMALIDLKVSMRSTDSLAEDASYFFAEVKRLQSIMQAVEKKPCFILLDEILRGTNSDDKRNGTIRFIEKLIHLKAIGVIATHDLEVCQTTFEYPDYLSNKCFEVDIQNDQLIFDYKLRDGICQNQSASFLMKKNGII